MILPASYLFSALLLILGLLCWGSWANTFKLTGKWRYELYYYDFAFGAFFIAVIAALTFGSMGWDGFSLLDDLRNAGKRQELFAFIGGAIFNLGNMLLMASLSLAGMSVAFPIGIGMAVITGVISIYFTHPGGNPVFLALGALAVSVAIVLAIGAYRSRLQSSRRAQSESAAKGKPARKVSASKAVLLALAGGLLLGCFPMLVEGARQTENGLGPYGIAFIFTAAMASSTFVYNLFFMNLPVQGQPVDFGEYFKGSVRQHGLGVLGGALFGLGTVATLVAFRAEGTAHAGPALSYALENLFPVVSALWGLFVWQELADTDGKSKTFMFLALVLFTAGIAAVAFAPQFGNAA
jgi:glucose uptake protein